MNKLKLYIDMDGVLVDFQSALDKQLPDVLEQYKGHEDDIPGIFNQMIPLEGSIDAVHKLSEHYDCYILSTAPWNNPSAWAAKVEWVSRYLDDVFHKKLILTHNKELLCDGSSYLIDDRDLHGADQFGEHHIHFRTDKFPGWSSVIEYLLPEQ